MKIYKLLWHELLRRSMMKNAFNLIKIFLLCIVIVLLEVGCESKNQNDNDNGVTKEEVLNTQSNETILNTTVENNGESQINYLLPNSSTELINEDLRWYTVEELDLMKNEIFARHGHDFSSQVLKEYFEKQYWYKPIEGKKVVVSELNNIEQKNVELLDKAIKLVKSNYDFDVFLSECASLKNESEILENVYLMNYIASDDYNYIEGIVPTLYYYMNCEIKVITNEDKIIIKVFEIDSPKYYINDDILTLLLGNVGYYYSIYNIDLENKRELTQDEFKKLYNIKDKDENHIYFINDNGELCYEVPFEEYENHVSLEEYPTKAYILETGRK